MRLSMNSWESAKDGSSARPRRYKCNKNKEEELEWRTRIVDVLAFSQEAKGGRGSLDIGGNSPPKKNNPQRRKKFCQVFTICHNDSQVQQPLLYYRGKLRSILSIFSTFTVIWVVKISILKTKLESTLSHITVTCETSANWKKTESNQSSTNWRNCCQTDKSGKEGPKFLGSYHHTCQRFFHNFTILKSYLDIKYLNNLEQILLAPIIIRVEDSETNQDFHSQ